MCNYLHAARVHKTPLSCLVTTHDASRWLRECACLCGAFQQRRKAVPQYRLALAFPLQYFCAAVTLLWYWPNQPLVRFESRFVCGPSNCGSAVLQSCNSNCTTDQHSKRDDHVRLTIQEETPSDAVKFAANLVTYADVFSTGPVVVVHRKAVQGTRVCGARRLSILSLIHGQEHGVRRNLPFFLQRVTH